MILTYFIGVSDLKDNTPINLNVDDKKLVMSIKDAQEIQIQQILGTNLYTKLKTLVKDNTITSGTNTSYKLLLDEYIIPTLIKFALVECLPFTNFKIENKNLGNQSSDNSTPVELDELKYFISLNKDKAEYYAQRLTDYLIANSATYPEYTTSTTCDQILPNNSSYFCGIQLDDDYNCDRFLGKNTGIIDLA